MEDNKKFFRLHGRPGEDFDLWEAQTETALASQDVLNVFTTNVVGQATAEAPLNDALLLEVAKARALIMQGVDVKSFRMCLLETEKPFEMWEKLLERYAVSKITTHVELQMNLNHLRYSEQNYVLLC